MNFFYRTFESAQEHARQAAAAATTSAQELAQQVTSHTASLASQAGSLSEHATERFKGLQFPEALQKQVEALQPKGQSSQQAPSQQQLEAYAITPDFQAFVRSLTYSTFREFPQTPGNNEPASCSTETSDTESTRYLTPWQEQHALLVVQAVKEINELRFVLCPKRMTDKQFWQTYFQLARKHLPAAAYDPAAEQLEPASPRQALDLHTRLQQLSTSAQAWGASTAASVAALARPASSKPSEDLGKGLAEPGTHSSPSAQSPAQQTPKLDDDLDLEAYLQVSAVSSDPYGYSL